MGGFWITIIFMVLTGLLAVSSMVAAKKPDAAAAINKLVPFQGIIGVLALAWGVWSAIELFTSGVGIGDMFAAVPLLTILAIAAIVLMILLGFLFGWGLIAKFTGGGAAGGGNAAQKLAAKQGPLGVAAIIVAILLVIFQVGGIMA